MRNVANVEMLPIANYQFQLEIGNIGTGNTCTKVDQIRQTIWTGGITSPITVLEQIMSVRPDGTRRNGP